VGILVTVTEKASQRLKEELEKAGQSGVRLYVQPGGCSGISYGMALDEPRDDDLVVELSGFKMYIDPLSGRYLKGAEVGYEESATGGTFTIDNPNEIPHAGCAGCSSRCGQAQEDDQDDE
jgi:iron-sulfur cluster assembly accessory protein